MGMERQSFGVETNKVLFAISLPACFSFYLSLTLVSGEKKKISRKSMQSAKYLDLYYFDYVMSLRVISVLNGKVLCGRLSACVHVRGAASA